ncbi:MAG: hypothetical protein LBG17_00550 [Bacteroidales bacterium]|jgi:phosphate-selective porin OprO/OprP|nr:hypothetical protein [Bacteroidales bacterium]
MKHPFLALLFILISSIAFSQSDDNDPSLVALKREWGDNIKWTVGARFMAEAAFYDNPNLRSGAAISDARLRTSLTYGNYYFYYDANFSNGSFSQKDVYFQYGSNEINNIKHNIKVGYFSNIASMSYNTSSFNYRFITRPAAVLAFSTQRHLGVAYKFKSKHIFFEQGIFSEKPYHRKDDSRGVIASGRFVYKALNTEKTTLHFGVSARYRKMLDDSVSFRSAASLETRVDENNGFLNITDDDVESASEGTFEFLFRINRFFVRGEYILRYVKDRNPFELYSGGYVESGFIILSNNGENDYEYNEKASVTGGPSGKHSLEAVARYSYTDLNIGGSAHVGTAGLSYFINKYIGFMAEYNIAFVKKNGIDDIVNMAQLKVMFSF